MENSNNSLLRKTFYAIVIILWVVGLSLKIIKIYSGINLSGYTIIIDELSNVVLIGCTIALVQKYFSETELVNAISKKIDDSVKREFSCTLKKTVISHEKRDGIEIGEKIKHSKKNIDLLVTNFNYFNNNIDELLNRVEKGVNLRILVLNPNDEFVKRRYKDLGNKSSEEFCNSIKTSFNEFINGRDEKELKAKLKGKIEIRIFSDSPSIMYFRIDNKIFISFILKQGRGRSYTHIEFRKDEGFSHADCFIEHFEKLWETAEIRDEKFSIDPPRTYLQS